MGGQWPPGTPLAPPLPLSTFRSLCSEPLRPTKTVLRGFGNNVVKPLGSATLNCLDAHGKPFRLLFYVTDAADVALLGSNACFQLNLLRLVNTCTSSQSFTLPQMLHDYADIFSGFGLYETEYHIQLKPGAVGVIQPPRKIPYAIQPNLKETLAELQSCDIIADVDTPTSWVSNLVVVEKKHKTLRVCLDPRPLNIAIMRERHTIPTAADVLAQHSGKKVFTVLDMTNGYWHVKLSDDSSYLTTFHTPRICVGIILLTVYLSESFLVSRWCVFRL